MKILNFGSSNIDFVYSLEHIVSAGETVKSNRMNIFPGGKGLNQSVALARAGEKIYHAGCFGSDGEMLVNLLKENGVDVSYIKFVDEKNGHAIIQVSDDGENSIVIYPGSNAMVAKDYIESVLDNFSGGDFLVLQNEISNIEYIIEKASERGMKIFLNPSPCSDNLRSIDFNMLSYIILNEGEAKQLSGCESSESALEYFAENYPKLSVVLTLGKKGSIFSGDGQKIFQPSFEVKTVDTTAAGDTFTGFFISMLSKGEAYKNALRISSAAAALSVSKNGAAPSIPRYDEVLSQICNLKENTSSILKDKINKYIDTNYKNVSVKEIAKVLGYSQSYTQAIVKKLYGKPISKVIQSKKCDIAARLLKETDMPINEIILNLGYENESFFRNIFKEKYGKNMLEYRNCAKN